MRSLKSTEIKGDEDRLRVHNRPRNGLVKGYLTENVLHLDYAALKMRKKRLAAPAEFVYNRLDDVLPSEIKMERRNGGPKVHARVPR